MSQSRRSRNLSEYRTVGEAAAFLGVSTATLRNWDRNGKLKPRRHPQNGYRIYLHEDLEGILRSADMSIETSESYAPGVNWRHMSDTDHFVQFYEDDDFLMESVCGFVASALSAGDGSVVIGTSDHNRTLRKKLGESGIDVPGLIADGRFVVLDAAETLSLFMVDGVPDTRRFLDCVGAVIRQVGESCRKIHAFGEMVALLWADGNRDAAIRLEGLWNDLSRTHRFALFCAYPVNGFEKEGDNSAFNGVCGCHSRVIPAESYSALANPDERIRAVSLLQQKARSLQAEITHRNEVERALYQREQELSEFFENASEGLHKVDSNGTILWANRAECEMLGYSPDEYVGRSITEFHVDADVIAEILRLLQSGETLENHHARLRCKNGSIKHVLINSSACFEEGKFKYSRCFSRDVTRRWKAERALREADRRKDEFLAMLAHELRNPLAPIKNALQILKTEGCTDEVLHVLQRQTSQLTRLVDDLLDMGRITRDKIELRKERVELSSIINTAVETSRPLISDHLHVLTVSLPNQPVYLDADPTRMAQVFSNLLNNSAKYTPEGGCIDISVRMDGSEVLISVRDNGVGISCEELAYVFDMFRQVDRSLERAQGGLGIGLTLVRRLVELHGGTANALSEGPGKGSEFIVRLPMVSSNERTAVEQSASADAAPSGQRILVVDDNADSCETLRMLLQFRGHDVRVAQDGQEAVELAAEFNPEVILMDIGMPRLNGYDATRQIRHLPGGENIFIVALSGWGQPADLEKSGQAGFSTHLLKPVDFAALELLLANRAYELP